MKRFVVWRGSFLKVFFLMLMVFVKIGRLWVSENVFCVLLVIVNKMVSG